MSTVVGKGTWGHEEGIEALYKLSPIGTGFVNNPLNYQRVQVSLSVLSSAASLVSPKTVCFASD